MGCVALVSTGRTHDELAAAEGEELQRPPWDEMGRRGREFVALAPTAEEIAAGFDDAEEFEFIELVNISDQAVDYPRVACPDVLVVLSTAAMQKYGEDLGEDTRIVVDDDLVLIASGRGVVVATGADTELGAIAGLMRSETVAATPLQRRMDHFARIIGIAAQGHPQRQSPFNPLVPGPGR